MNALSLSSLVLLAFLAAAAVFLLLAKLFACKRRLEIWLAAVALVLISSALPLLLAGLNLQGTEWVVLSACDTGVGQVKAGEGVFGLRRAFHVAGVRTIIMSLWSVEDRSTQVWMRHLYEARFNRRLSTAASMREASLRVLEERRSRRASTHPFFWAGFVAAGSWE